jgi:BlaI family penicillinase repressor
MRLLWEHGEL